MRRVRAILRHALAWLVAAACAAALPALAQSCGAPGADGPVTIAGAGNTVNTYHAPSTASLAAGLPREPFAQLAVLIKRDRVDIPVVVPAFMHDRTRRLAGQILLQRAAQRHVDQLQPAANAENRFAGFHELVQQLHLVGIAHRVAGPLRPQWFFAIGVRADVGAALQNQPIEKVGIVAKLDGTAQESAALYDRRHHQHHHITIHYPVGHRLLEHLKRPGANALAALLGVKNARRQADVKRAPSSDHE